MPILTLFLVLANFVAYGAELAAGGLSACEAYGLVPARFVQTGNLAPLFTALFLHDPSSLGHLLGNMGLLLVVGTLVERGLGLATFGSLYAGAGFAGGLVHVFVSPAANYPMVGASGAISGLVAAAAVIRPRFAAFGAVIFVGANVYYAFSGADAQISFGAHLGGFTFGFLVVLMLRVINGGALSAEPA